MNKMLKKINVFMVAVSIFALMCVYCVYVYIMYNRPAEMTANASSSKIEIDLPSFEWDKYSALSRKINITSTARVKRKVAENVGLSGMLEPK